MQASSRKSGNEARVVLSIVLLLLLRNNFALFPPELHVIVSSRISIVENPFESRAFVQIYRVCLNFFNNLKKKKKLRHLYLYFKIKAITKG